jgi:hypothetical protein
MVEQARYELRLMNIPIVGVVVSNFAPRKFRSYGAGYGYHRYTPDGAAHKRAGESPQAIVRADGRNDPFND